MKGNLRIATVVLLLCICVSPALAQFEVFDKTVDWPQMGQFNVPGEVSVSGSGTSAVYTVKGNGDNIGSNTESRDSGGDEGFFVYKELSGSWSLQAKVAWVDAYDNSEIGVMIREQAEKPGSNYYWIETFQWGAQTLANFRNRLQTGGTAGVQLYTPEGNPVEDPGEGLWIRVTRIAPIHLFYCEYSFDGNDWFFANGMTQVWDSDTAAYGIAITSGQDDDWLVEASATDVALTTPPPVAVRSLSQAAFAVGDTIEVSIDVINPGESATDATVKETIPEGWTASNISYSGVEANGVIAWNLSSIPAGSTVLTYQAAPPTSPGDKAIWEGVVEESNVVTQGKAGLLFSAGGFERISDGMVVLYTFDTGEGDTIHDVSGVGDPMDLTIGDVSRVRWESGFITVTAPTLISTEGPAIKIHDAIVATNEITIEAWITPDNIEQNGTARIVTYSDNIFGRNFTLGQGRYNQGGDRWQFRLRTTENVRDGSSPALVTNRGTLEAVLTHIVFTRNEFWEAGFYINNVLTVEGNQPILEGLFPGDLVERFDEFDDAGWDPTLRFGLANEINGAREWLGEFHVVAIYNRGLTEEEIAQNYAAGPNITLTVDVKEWSIF